MLADETWMSGADVWHTDLPDQVTPAVEAMACIQSKRTEDLKDAGIHPNMITPPRNSAPRDTTVTIPAPAVQNITGTAVSDEATIRARVMADRKPACQALTICLPCSAVAIRRFRTVRG